MYACTINKTRLYTHCIIQFMGQTPKDQRRRHSLFKGVILYAKLEVYQYENFGFYRYISSQYEIVAGPIISTSLPQMIHVYEWLCVYDQCSDPGFQIHVSEIEVHGQFQNSSRVDYLSRSPIKSNPYCTIYEVCVGLMEHVITTCYHVIIINAALSERSSAVPHLSLWE